MRWNKDYIIIVTVHVLRELIKKELRFMYFNFTGKQSFGSYSQFAHHWNVFVGMILAH